MRKPYFMQEDVDQMIARAKARNEATSRGIKVNGTMQLDDIEAAIRKDDIQKNRHPRLKLVFVDSSKLGHVNLQSEGLWKRRQSAPATADGNKAKPAISASKKRSLGRITDGVKDSSPDDPEEIQPRKKHRSTLKLITRPQESTPFRQKRQSIGKTQATPGSKSVGKKATPHGRRSAVKNVQSEKANKGRAISFTPVNAPRKTEAVESPSALGRPRRRTAGTPSLKSAKSMPNLLADS
jgi:hypothetical protein